jgi:uncharacterized protein
MKWTPGGVSEDVEDRRSQGGGGGGFRGGPVSIGVVLFLLAISLLTGRNFLSLIDTSGGSDTSAPATAAGPVQSSPEEEQRVQFVSFVLDDVQKTWQAVLPGGYRKAKLVLFRDATDTACGTGQTSSGPFYCPEDEKVYIDLGFYEELKARFGASGDFAQAYVIAHELGHHVQNQLGLMGKGAPDSIHIELQADCLAGAWGKDANTRGLLEIGDVDEALNAAAQIGDDTLQKKETGHVQPETWTHGSSAQRVASFKKGYDGGPKACGI